MNRRLLTCGEHAVLVEVDALEEVLALDLAVRGAVDAGDTAFADVVDVVPAARTLLVVVRDGTDVMPVRTALTTLSLPTQTLPTQTPSTQALPTQTLPTQSPSTQAADGPESARQGASRGTPNVIEILVHYDGPDLDEVAKLTGLSAGEVVAAHTQTSWRVAFAGFAPGFAYLAGGDPRLQVPRRGEPRTSVPAGSVGLAGEFSAVYPRSSPGGWQLLGHTDAILWDVDRQPPALLRSGSLVRFVDADSDDLDSTGLDNTGLDNDSVASS
jgi:KipI family sensor histidine kinase inhibitor